MDRSPAGRHRATAFPRRLPCANDGAGAPLSS